MGLTLRRIAAGVRLVGLGWMLLLVLLAVTRDDEMTRPVVAWALVAAGLVWAAITGLDQFRPHERDPWWITAGDAVLASAALFSPLWAGTADLIYGGYPAIAVAASAATERRRGWGVAAVLSMVTLFRLRVDGLGDLLSTVSQLISYGMVAGIVGWAAHVIFTADQARRTAEAAQARAEERGQVAAHLHDSVLQTLALIQRDPADPKRVAAVARRQERELRDWLYGSDEATALGLVGAVQAAAAEVDADYGVRIEVVAVGDTAMNERTTALVAASREAMVNAAKHAGAGVSVYLESGLERIRLFVRDRGPGFDSSQVPLDRHGIRESIEKRLEKVGGTAIVESVPGKGTEVRLEMPT